MAGMPNNASLGTHRAAAEQQRLFNKGTSELPVSDLLPSPENGRKRLRNVEGLADSYDDDGVVQALTVVTAEAYVKHYPQHHEHVTQSGKPFVVLHGHRRLAAAKLRGLEKVPVFIRKTVAENGSLRIAAMKENEQRLGLDPIEQGADYQAALDELGISQRELAKRLGQGTSQTAISHKIKLLGLIEPLQNAVIDHWCRQRGLDVEFGGELLLPIKEAATVFAGLRQDLQQAYVDGALSAEDAQTIVKSKVPLEEQQLPSQQTEEPEEPESGTNQSADGASTNGTTGQSQPPSADSGQDDQGGQQQDAGGNTGTGGGENPPAGSEVLPAQRSTGTNEGETGADADKPETGASQNPPGTTAPEGTGGTSTTTVTQTQEPQQTTGTVVTLTDRGVIAVTTVKDIYTGLKERLSAEEFEELQELILED
ncbi:ParB/RepB/Spo0J family partition protein [Streptomyces sp. IBSBF 2950]|uniref:ParB/RepB/Spo0J family partition protein n=1 Tax=Streptomyces sp. IBSBF 2950 TaxID=2903528 RepID=UPI002FDBBFB5